MHIYKQYTDFKKVKPLVLTIGTFDGVHLGHRKILSKIKEICEKKGAESCVMTFDPHPRKILFPDKNELKILSTISEKTKLLSENGIQHLIIQPFTKEFSKVSSHEYIHSILENGIKPDILVIGYDHRFGSNREGNLELLQKSKVNFEIVEIPAFEIDQLNVSSTKIRTALSEGEIKQANNFLGYTFFIHANVIEGKKLGRSIGFPTANLHIDENDKLIPANGVYAVMVEFEGKKLKGMMNIGTNPSVSDDQHLKLEVHLLNFDGDLYDKTLKISFLQKMRKEQKFATLEELKHQLEADKLLAAQILNE